MSNQLVTIATFNFTTDPSFLVFKAALKHHGISFHAADEHTVNADPLLSIVVGGIRVMVHEDDVPAAIRIWREINDAEVNTAIEEDADNLILDDKIINSPNTENQGNTTYFIWVLALISLLLLALLFVTLSAL